MASQSSQKNVENAEPQHELAMRGWDAIDYSGIPTDRRPARTKPLCLQSESQQQLPYRW